MGTMCEYLFLVRVFEYTFVCTKSKCKAKNKDARNCSNRAVTINVFPFI